MSKHYSTDDLARHFGISRSQVYRELQSFPHQGAGTTNIHFTDDDLVEIERLLSAGPDEQLHRLLAMEAKRDELRAVDDLDELAV